MANSKIARRRPWPLRRLMGTHRSAPLVWLALLQLSVQTGSLVVTPTRQELVELSGISRPQTISKALSTLVSAGWIHRKQVHAVDNHGIPIATMLKITLLRQALANFRSVNNKKRSSRQHPSQCEQQETVADSLRERAHTSPLRGAGALVGNNHNDIQEKQPELALLNDDGVPVGVAEMQATLRGAQTKRRQDGHER